MAETEWHNRSFFAEVAEALDVSTDCIMAASTQKGWWWVLYTETPETDEHDWIYLAVLSRDDRNLLQIQDDRMTIQMRDFHGQIAELMKEVFE